MGVLLNSGDSKRSKERRKYYKTLIERDLGCASSKSKEQIHNEKINDLKNKPITKGQLFKIIELSQNFTPGEIFIGKQINNSYDAKKVIDKLLYELKIKNSKVS